MTEGENYFSVFHFSVFDGNNKQRRVKYSRLIQFCLKNNKIKKEPEEKSEKPEME